MKAIIVQGGSYYGLNVRIVSDKKALKVKQAAKNIGMKEEVDVIVKSKGGGERYFWDEPCLRTEPSLKDFYFYIVPVEKGKSFGFESGMWDMSEKLLKKLLK